MPPARTFGWSLPPGCTQRMLDDAVGADLPDDGDCDDYIENCGYLDFYEAPDERLWYVLYDTLDSTPSWCMWMIPNQKVT